LYNILIEIGMAMKPAGLIKMCLNKPYRMVRVGKHLSNMFPIKNGLKQGEGLSPLILNFACMNLFHHSVFMSHFH
jgi:hypothetical protein